MNDTSETGQPSADDSRTTWRSLTFQMLAIVVFPLIVLLLIVTFSSTTLHQQAMREMVGDRDARAARMAATAIEDQVQRRANELRALAGQVSRSLSDQSPSDQPPSDQTSGDRGTAVLGSGALRSSALQSSAYLSSDFDMGMAVLGKGGEVITFQGKSTIWHDQSTTIAQGIAALEKNPEMGVYISRVYVLSNQPSALMIVMALAADQQSVIAGGFSIGPMVEHVVANLLSPNQDTSVAVVSPAGDVLFRKGFDSRAETVNHHAGVADALAGKSGNTYIDVGGSEHVVAYSAVQPFGWALLIEEPWEQVASPVLETTHMAPLIFVPVLLLALLAVFFGIRQIVQPLQALARESSKLGWGDYSAIEKPVGGVLEIRQLQLELIHMAHKLRAAQQSLRSYIGAITSGQEEERRRLARELHDDTIQSLIALKQRVQLVEMDWEGHPVAQALAELEQVSEQTIENLRRMVSALRPIYLEDLGLVASIDMLVSDTGKKLGSTVAFERKGKERRLEAPAELALYRIVQEALSNITRHSGAGQVSVQVSFQKEGICVSIEDNGKGFVVPRSPAEFAPSGHFGLLGMFERAELIGGAIKVDSDPGRGTRLVITVPYTAFDLKMLP